MINKVRKKPNILWILLDACRQDRMSCYGYRKRTTPNLEKISKESTIFENAIVNAPWTLPSVSSMFTGLYPSQHGALDWGLKINSNVNTIAEILKGEGYNTIAIGGAWIPTSRLSRGFRLYEYEKAIFYSLLTQSKSRSKLQVELSKKFIILRSLFSFFPFIEELNVTLGKNIIKELAKSSEKPFFLYFHLSDTHLPYKPPVKFQRFNDKKYYFDLPLIKDKLTEGVYKDWIKRRFKQLAGLDEFSDYEFSLLNQLYDSSVYYVDYQIGEYLDVLDVIGVLDQTMVIITADHGENIGDHGLIDHQNSLHDTLLKVPLIIRYPQLFPGGKRIKGQVELKDIFYTILDVINHPPPDSKISNSFLRYAIENKGRKYVFGEYYTPEIVIKAQKTYFPEKPISTYSCFIREKNFKYILHNDGKEEFYSLKNGEKKVSPKDFLNEFLTMKKRLFEWRTEINMEKRKEIKEKINRLKRLGKL